MLGRRMGESLRCSPWLRLVRGLRLGHGLLLLLQLGVLLLGGSCFVLAQTAGLSCTVDLTERVQRLALGVLQQVRLALGGRNRSHVCQQHTSK